MILYNKTKIKSIIFVYFNIKEKEGLA